MRRNERIISIAAIVAVAVNTDGHREVLGIAVMPSGGSLVAGSFIRATRWNASTRRSNGAQMSSESSPNEAAITRLAGALMLEHNDEWALTRRYMTLETVQQVCHDDTLDAAQIASI